MIKLTDLLKEQESFTATSKKSGETAVFKTKDSRDAAIKAGTHDKIEDTEDDKDNKGKQDMFSKDSGYDAPDINKTPSKDEPVRDDNTTAQIEDVKDNIDSLDNDEMLDYAETEIFPYLKGDDLELAKSLVGDMDTGGPTDDLRDDLKDLFDKKMTLDSPKAEPSKDEPKKDGPKVDLDLSYHYADDIESQIEKLEGKISDEDYKKLIDQAEDLKYAQLSFEDADSYDSPEEAEEDGLTIYTKFEIDKMVDDLKDKVRQANGTPKEEPKAEPKKEKPKSEPKKDEPKRVPLDQYDGYYIKSAVEKRMGRDAFKKLSYGELQKAYDDEKEKQGWEEDENGNWTKPANESVKKTSTKLKDLLPESIINEGTRSQVGVIGRNGKIVSAYVHYDGYPDNMKPDLLNENYKGSFSDFKYEFGMALDNIGISPKAIKSISKKGKGYEVRLSSYMSEESAWKKIGEKIGADLIDFKKGTINIGLYESTKVGQLIKEGTRSQVGVIGRNGKIVSAYVHYDGYPDNMKPGLKHHMKNEKDVLKLIKMGGARGIFNDKDIEYYKSGQPMKGDFKDVESYIKDADMKNGAEYVYLYNVKDKKWYYADTYKDTELKKLF